MPSDATAEGEFDDIGSRKGFDWIVVDVVGLLGSTISGSITCVSKSCSGIDFEYGAVAHARLAKNKICPVTETPQRMKLKNR